MKKNIRDSYKRYCRTTNNPVDLKVYTILTGDYNKFLIQKVLEGSEVTLPARMGTLTVVGRKQKVSYDENGKIRGLAPDWVKTKKLWDSNSEARKNKQLLYHLNSHTDNVRYKYLWSKLQVLAENKTLYALRLTRDNKRAVYNMIKQGKLYKTK